MLLLVEPHFFPYSLFTFTPAEKHQRNLDRLRLYLKVLSIGGTYRHVTERAPTAKLGGDRWILNFSGRSCAWKARYIDLDQHMVFFVPLDRGIYAWFSPHIDLTQWLSCSIVESMLSEKVSSSSKFYLVLM